MRTHPPVLDPPPVQGTRDHVTPGVSPSGSQMSQSSRSVSRGLTISAPTSSAEGRGVSEALQISALVPDMQVQPDAASDEMATLAAVSTADELTLGAASAVHVSPAARTCSLEADEVSAVPSDEPTTRYNWLGYPRDVPAVYIPGSPFLGVAQDYPYEIYPRDTPLPPGYSRETGIPGIFRNNVYLEYPFLVCSRKQLPGLLQNTVFQGIFREKGISYFFQVKKIDTDTTPGYS